MNWGKLCFIKSNLLFSFCFFCQYLFYFILLPLTFSGTRRRTVGIRSYALGGINIDIRSKIQGIPWASSSSHKVFEFTFGDSMDSGEVYFGIICLAKSPDGQKVDAVSSLYRLNFTLAQERVVTEETFKLLGFIPLDSKKSVHYRRKNLGCFSKQQVSNFCRMKAMEAFKSKGFIHHVPYVTSLSAVNN